MMFMVTSCDEDQILENTAPAIPQAEEMMSPVLNKSLPDPDNADGSDSLECFTFNYPIEVVLTDGSTASSANDDAFFELLANGAEIIDFVYPFSVTLADESEATINGFEELIEVLTTCFGDFDDWDDDGDWDGDHGDCPDDFDFEGDCFEITYPLTVAVNGENVTIESDEDFEELLSSFEGDTISEFEFVFPFNVFIFADSSTVEIASEEDLEDVIESCGFGEWDDLDFGPWMGQGCFELNYPLNLLVNDQSVTINNEDDLIDVFANLDGNEDASIELEYPVSITLYSDSTTVTVNSEEEWEAILEDACDFDDGGWDDDDDDDDWDPNEGYGCFEVNFPLNLSVNGELVTINSEDDFITILTDIGDVEEVEIELVYPITVTIFSDSSTVVINSEEEWEALCDACHFDGGDGDFDDECFTINYPLGVLIAGETITVEDEEALGELFNEINPEDFGGFAFPLSVTIEDTGEIVTINNEEELAGLEQYCN
jgi:hypothetical protein